MNKSRVVAITFAAVVAITGLMWIRGFVGSTESAYWIGYLVGAVVCAGSLWIGDILTEKRR